MSTSAAPLPVQPAVPSRGSTPRTHRLATEAADRHYTLFSERQRLEESCPIPVGTGPCLAAALRFAHVYRNATPCLYEGELIAGAWQRGGEESGWNWLPGGDEPYVELLAQRAPAHRPEIAALAARGLLSPAAPFNHKAADYGMFIRTSSRELARRAREQAAARDGKERDFALAFALGHDALIEMAAHYAKACDGLAATADTARAAELREMARICRKVPAEPAETFHEAVQSYWFGYLVAGDATGRLDQILIDYYRADLAAGRLTREGALELLECLLIKIHDVPREGFINVSSIQTMTLGGILPDGREGTNELTALILTAARHIRLLRPTIYLRCSAETPDAILDQALEMLGDGLSEPHFYGEAPIIDGLTRIGIPRETARDFAVSGCTEIVSPGRGNWGAITGWVNLARLADDAIRESAAEGARDAGALWAVLDRQIDALADACRDCTEWLDDDPRFAGVRYDVSLLMPVCLERCRDFAHGGAETCLAQWNGVGLANAADMLHAAEQLAFTGDASLASLLARLDAGDPALLARLRALPKFGNDCAEVDELAARLVTRLADAMERRTTARRACLTFGHLSGGENMHLAYGQMMGATLDGRRAGQPLADSLAGAQGRTRSGPTAVIRSLGRLDHSRLQAGNVSTLRLAGTDLATPAKRRQVRALVRAFVALGGSQLQLNVADAATLLRAQEHPDDFRGLMVRVAGYSADFTHLGKTLQNEIIARTEGFSN